MNSDAVEIVEGQGAALLTAEHASNVLPDGWSWRGQPELANQHWGVDLGIASLTRALARALDVPAVLAGFSRLLIDPNRPLDSDTLFREVADGRQVNLNVDVTAEDAQRRIDRYYQPYHDAVAATLRANSSRFLLSMHSFTPLYEGRPRAVEIGVLHPGAFHELAQSWCDILSSTGRDVRVNEPYSGAGGFMYSAETHAQSMNIECIELEIRQDLLATDAHHPEFISLIESALKTSGHR